MGHLIRLRYDQTQSISFKHELLDHADTYKLTDEEYAVASREEKQLSKLWVVRRLVGRYLYHWPISRVWLDDMCSAALEGLCESQHLEDEKKLLDLLQRRIEQTLNNLQSIVRASLSTNMHRSADNMDLEYADSMPLSRNVGTEDDELRQVDEIDSLTKKERNKYDKYREAPEA